ncbi:hypothetical protein DM01DRAFT_1336584 [Hesseltinella vesiculosa]|uniref:BZIP domain-containing protein n=1 Tax=Hesseltinella vesiculosa TaxID=101127 RepID=A0A1X2GG03_9FUNG|nr:hypothetical protein DM01DRAFT_1336584 [Hesseltinella vesiculosa]
MSLASNNKVEIDQATIDLINAAILSNKTVLQQQLLHSLEERQRESTKAKGAKRTLDSTGEESESGNNAPKRPGRKPLDKSTIALDAHLDPKAKRKAQNRRAQRAFRERKEQHVSELEARIKELEDLGSKTDQDLREENNRLRAELQQLQEENSALKDAQFTFEFPHIPPPSNPSALPKSEPEQKESTPSAFSSSSLTSPDTPNYMSFMDDSAVGDSSSSSSTEQSPLSMAAIEDDSDAPTSNTSATTPFLTFGSVLSSSSPSFDLLGTPTTTQTPISLPTSDLVNLYGTAHSLLANVKESQPLPTSATNNGTDFKQLFHGKDDLFSDYRAPSTDQTLADDAVFDGFGSLFGNDDLLYGFPSQHDAGKFSMNDFYFPSLEQPQQQDQRYLKKDALEASLHRATEEGLRAYDVQKELQQCPDFDLDALCSDLHDKAKCSESTYIITDKDVKLYMKCFENQLV